ncbi:MAG: aminopeptidase [Bacilli bacterium]|nr:aminopeptidase [Bacilli bacterium]
MDKTKLRKYAELLAKVGINVQKGEEVWINCQLDQPEFVRMVVEELYKAGASKVKVEWFDDQTTKLHYKNQKLSTLSKVDSITLARYKYMAKKYPCLLHIISEDPDAFKGVNQNKVSKARAKSYPKIKPYRDATDGKQKWCIAAVPNVNWAKKVFPKLNEEEAVEALWDAIFKTSRVDENNAVENWNKHNADLIDKRNKLMAMNLASLEYKASNGTDFKVGLIPNMKWGAGIENCLNKSDYNPNIPTEEVFTTPMSGKAEGRVVASMPLSYNGELIEDFYIDFKDGKVSNVFAKKNQKLLETMVKMDEGASKLGEVALVPYTSPIRETGILFYNTLFDENAACHVALGCGFAECLPNGLNMTHEEVVAAGVNDSMIHVDFMIGTKDLSIVGVDQKGNRIQIFKDGVWTI